MVKMKKLKPLRVISSAAPSLCFIVALFAPIVMAQIPGAAPLHAGTVLTSSGRATLDLDRPDPLDLLREIDDPALGRRWLLYRDPRHPQGPGRLVAADAPMLDHPNNSATLLPGATRSLPVIRAGDRVILEESTPIVEARLEAIALIPAFQGSPLKVRLVLGGKIVTAIAVAPGRVALASPPESRP